MTFDLTIIGKTLRARREELGLTESEIAKRLNLRSIMIKSVEDGQWKALPHEFYVKGYVKEYGKLLGIEDTVNELLAPQKEADDELVPVEPVRAEKPARRLPLGSLFKPKRISKSALVYGAVVLLVFAFYLVREQEKTQVAGPERSAVTQSAPETESVRQPVAHEASGEKKLMITCHERTWLSIVIDGNEKKEFMLNPEEVVLLNGQDRFDLLVGNAGGIKIFINGKDTGFSGENREVKRITLP